MKSKTAIICLSRVNGGMELASVKLARLLSTDVEIEFILYALSSTQQYRPTLSVLISTRVVPGMWLPHFVAVVRAYDRCH